MANIILGIFCLLLHVSDDPPSKTAPPQRPPANEEFRAAYVEIGTKLMDQRNQWLAEKDEKKKELIMKGMINTMAEKLLPLARKYPDARESLAFLMECAATGHEGGIQLLLQHYDKRTDLGDGCINVAVQAIPLGNRVCETVLERSTNPENKARACLGLGYWLMKQGDAADGQQASDWYVQAQKRMKQAAVEYGDIKINFGQVRGIQTVKALAEQALNEMASLTIGKTAPELTGIDLDGKPLSLKEHRGKIVMVSFWAHWCGPCMALVPHERELVERYAGKPFVLLGVNGDEPGEELLAKNKKNQITWRSLQNAGNQQTKLSDQWNVMTWPTVYLIDAQGVIRKKWVGRVDVKQLDEALESMFK